MTIAIERFGKDHWSTFMYIETCCVDDRGRCDRRRLRTDGARFPTRLKGGETIECHDDLDCADDLEAAGLLESLGTGTNPMFKLTPAGWVMASKLRQYRAEGKNVGDFRP